MLAALSLTQREFVRFVRQPNRVVGALLTPVVFWLLIGAGVGRSFDAPGVGTGGHYLAYFFPGTLLMILLFTAVFSTISVIEDRREGFLQSVLVAPVGRQAIVMGKLLGGTLLASGQGLLFLLAAPLIGLRPTLAGAIGLAGFMLLTSFALTALGFCLAWRMSSTQGFHALMNLFLMPLWFLSGALFPASGAWGGLAAVMYLNPLTYALSGMRQSLAGPAPGEPALLACWSVTVLMACGLFALACFVARKTTAADLQ